MEQKKIGSFIAACRKQHGMTQVQFAEKLGVTNKAVSKWETGKCMPDASLFDDICLLLNITLNELFAGERIASDDIPKKAEENLKSMALEYQKENKKIVFCKSCTILLTLVVISLNLSVGGILFEGTPVLANLLAVILLMISWLKARKSDLLEFLQFLYWTQQDVTMQKIATIINAIFLLSSITAFILAFWDIQGTIVHLIGFPCEVVFYGLRPIFEWIHIYLIVAILVSIGLAYSKKNIATAIQK